MSLRLIAVLLLLASAHAQQPGTRVESEPARTVVVSDLPPANADSGSRQEIDRPHRAPRVYLKPEVLQSLHASATVQPASAPSLQSFAAPALSPAFTTNFLGLDDNDFAIPPDTDGAIGPTRIVTALNSELRITDRAGVQISRVSMTSFMGSTNVFDPHVLYDPYSDRWMLTMAKDPESASSSIVLMISQTGDPAGAWKSYSLDADPTDNFWADYPTIGFNKDWIVVSANLFPFGTATGFPGSKVFVFDKANLYSGNAVAKVTIFDDPAYTDVPAVTYDPTLSTVYLVANYGDQQFVVGDQNNAVSAARISRITGPVGSEVFHQSDDDGPFVVVNALGDFDSPNNDADFAPQSSSANKIQTNDGRIGNLVYRNGALWFAHTTFLPDGGPARSAIQWYQALPSGTVAQLGRIDDASGQFFFAFPSIAVNANNDALIGYSRFAASQFASAAYSFRAGTDAPNTLQSPLQYKDGLASYFKTFGASDNRWGDYSTTQVDPVNDLDLWTLQEFADAQNPASSDPSRWSTWWARVPRTASSAVTVNPPALSFGYSLKNDPAFSEAITITNHSASQVFDGGTFTGDFFSAGNTCANQRINTGATCTIQIVFSPSASGARSGSFSTSSDLGQTLNIPLSGTGFDVFLTLSRPLRPARVVGSTQIQSTSAVMSPGETLSYPLTVTTSGGYTGPIQFSCSDIPRTLRCTISSQAINATAAPTQLQVQLSAVSSHRAARLRESLRRDYSVMKNSYVVWLFADDSELAIALRSAARLPSPPSHDYTVYVNASIPGSTAVRQIPLHISVQE